MFSVRRHFEKAHKNPLGTGGIGLGIMGRSRYDYCDKQRQSCREV